MRLRLLAFVCCALLTIPMAALAASHQDDAAQCMALNLYWEARSEGREGMLAVGWVVLNRVAHAKYPSTVCGVIRQGGSEPPCQWSWWCDGRSDRPTEPKSWASAQAVARELLGPKPTEDPTYGALWFHHEKLGVPKWLKSKEPTAYIGRHIFYK